MGYYATKMSLNFSLFSCRHLPSEHECTYSMSDLMLQSKKERKNIHRDFNSIWSMMISFDFLLPLNCCLILKFSSLLGNRDNVRVHINEVQSELGQYPRSSQLVAESKCEKCETEPFTDQKLSSTIFPCC